MFSRLFSDLDPGLSLDRYWQMLSDFFCKDLFHGCVTMAPTHAQYSRQEVDAFMGKPTTPEMLKKI